MVAGVVGWVVSCVGRGETLGHGLMWVGWHGEGARGMGWRRGSGEVVRRRVVSSWYHGTSQDGRLVAWADGRRCYVRRMA